MFQAGYLSAEAAALLNEMARQYMANGMRVGVTSWPLSVHRLGRNLGTAVGFDPKALNPYFWAEVLASGGAVPYTGPGTGEVDGDQLAYSWAERVQTPTGIWTDGPRSGEYDAYVVEPEAGYTETVANGSVVLMRASATVGGTYEFLPPGASTGGGDGVFSMAPQIGEHTLTSSSGTWEDIVIFTPPEVTGYVFASVHGRLNTNTVGDTIQCRLIRTSGSTLVLRDTTVVQVQATGVEVQGTAYTGYTATLLPEEHKLQCRRVYGGSVSLSKVGSHDGLAYGAAQVGFITDPNYTTWA